MILKLCNVKNHKSTLAIRAVPNRGGGGVEKGYIPKGTYLDATERSNTHVEEHSIQDWHRNEL